MTALLIVGLAVVLMLAGAGIAYVVGALSVTAFVLTDHADHLAILPQQVFSKLDVFALMSMPLFILTGELMNRAGVTRALIEFSMLLMGRLRGGLGHVNILTSVFFAGISGSAVADAAALSNTLVPEMRARGYSARYAGAVTAASSVIGPIIPPSIILIFYGAIMGTSVPALFMAGVLPGLLLATALLVLNAYFARRDAHPRMERHEIPPFWATVIRALPALSLPVIILGGIVFGVTTPTEAAAVAVVAAIASGWFYGGLTGSAMRDAALATARLTGSIFIILVAVAALGHLAALEQFPQRIADAVQGLGLGPVGYMLLLNLIFLAVGMFFDIPLALALIVPLLVPPAIAAGFDPVHVGMVICFNLCLGLITPPMGGCLMVVSAVTRVGYWELSRAILPFVVAEVLVLAALVIFPEISLWLPRMAGLL
ncbi:MAG: TRAP transporter large permease [Burkholderiaceae bacterium]